MSYSFTAEPAQSLDEHPLSEQALGHDAKSPPTGQRHDRVQVQEPNPTTGEMPGSGSGSDTVEITTYQRMVSATWGSVLTSLLGMS